MAKQIFPINGRPGFYCLVPQDEQIRRPHLILYPRFLVDACGILMQYETAHDEFGKDTGVRVENSAVVLQDCNEPTESMLKNPDKVNYWISISKTRVSHFRIWHIQAWVSSVADFNQADREHWKPPSISDEELQRRVSVTRHFCTEVQDVSESKQKVKTYIARLPDGDELKTHAYTWAPYDRRVEDVEEGRLVKIGSFPTLHSMNCSVFFRPTAAEVLAQIPAELFQRRQADGMPTKFLITTRPVSKEVFKTCIHELCHIAVTHVYVDPSQEYIEPMVLDDK